MSVSEGAISGRGGGGMLEAYRIANIPPSMYYIPNFVTESEEAMILNKIPANKWISLSKRRLQAVPSQLTANSTLLGAPLPAWLRDPVTERLNNFEIFKGAPHGVNHCLINEYQPGQGIMPHEDGDAYFPVVATVSLGGALVLDVTGKQIMANTVGPSALSQDEAKTWRILQEPRSLLVTTSSAYTGTLHGIADVDNDVDLTSTTVANWELLDDKAAIAANGGRNQRTTRISLTYRDVKRVSNVGSKILGKRKV